MLLDQCHDQIGKFRITGFDYLPDMVKTAEDKIVSEDLSKVADGLFAYSDGIDRYFPLHTPEHCWYSRGYFEKCASTLNEPLREAINDRINDAWKFHELPEVEFSKEAEHEDEVDAIHALATEMHNFIEHYKRLHIHERREKAKELVRHAFALNKHEGIHEIIKRYAGENLRQDHGQAFAKRMQFFHHDSPERQMLLRLQEETPKVNDPERACKALHIFDERSGISKLYDNELEDPYLGLLTDKQNEEHIDIDGHKMLPSHLKGFNFDSLKDLVEDALIQGLKSDPIENLRNLAPHVRLVVLRHVNNHG